MDSLINEKLTPVAEFISVNMKDWKATIGLNTLTRKIILDGARVSSLHACSMFNKLLVEKE